MAGSGFEVKWLQALGFECTFHRIGVQGRGFGQRKCRKTGVVEDSRRGYLQYLVQGVRWIESKVTGKGMGLGTGMQVTVLGWV